MNWLLIDMTNYHVIGRFESEAEADAAKEAFDRPSNVRAIGGAWDGFTGVDLAKLFNALPSVKPVQRFATRDKGRDRVDAALLTITGVPDYSAPVNTTITVPTAEPIQETTDMAAKAKIKRVPKKTNGDIDPTVTLTAAGKKDKIRFNSGSARSKVFEAIKKSDGAIALSELIKKCAHFAKRGQVLGCVEKLKLKGYIS